MNKKFLSSEQTVKYTRRARYSLKGTVYLQNKKRGVVVPPALVFLVPNFFNLGTKIFLFSLKPLYNKCFRDLLY